MAIIPVKIDSILGGESALEYFAADGQFQSSVAIDPDFPRSDSAIRTAGLLRPVAMAKFSGSNIDSAPLWIITNPKTSTIYVYQVSGKFVSYSSAFGSETLVGTPTSGAGNGGLYYDNYIWLMTPTNMSRYGPLDGSPSLTDTVWTGATFMNDANKALTNTTYPTIRGVVMPNHVAHRHTDGAFYVCDVVNSTGGSAATKNQGCLHKVASTQTTVEGDTNNGSAYNAIDFPFGWWPTTIETYQTNLAVALIEGVNTTINQKHAKLSFWDTTSGSYQQVTDVEFPDPLITALKNINGVLYVFSGNASGGYRISKFAGGYSFEEIYFSEEGCPPLQGAVDHELNRLVWGNYITDPVTAAIVKSFGSKKRNVPMGVHTPFRSTSGGTTQLVTAVKYVEQANFSRLRPIIGWHDDSGSGIDSISTTYQTSVFRSEMYRVGAPFQVKKVVLPLAQAVAANMTITPKIYVDDGSTSSSLTTINSTNYANSERHIEIVPTSAISGKHNFFLELTWSGTALAVVGLPITIEIEILEEATQ